MARALADMVLLKLPTDATIQMQGRPVALLDQPAMAGLAHRPGVALVDFAHKRSKHYGCVVEMQPFDHPSQPDLKPISAMLGLAADVAIEAPKPGPQPAAGPAPPAPVEKPGGLSWHTEYRAAMEEAERQGKMLLIFFYRDEEKALCDEFQSHTLSDATVAGKLAGFVRAKLPADAKIAVQGKEVRLLQQPSFAEMQGRSGLAVIDFHKPACPHCDCVVSTFPFLGKTAYSAAQMNVILDLPPGTLTQRTLIYAVRTHPERPASTQGQLNPELIKEAERQSAYQARIRLQGHHFWETRFQRLLARLPRGQTPCEVCAESWPGQGLLEAALECVRCWRLSSGHWRAVSSRQDAYAYDMKRGSNGVWYATGVFGGRN